MVGELLGNWLSREAREGSTPWFTARTPEGVGRTRPHTETDRGHTGDSRQVFWPREPLHQRHRARGET